MTARIKFLTLLPILSVTLLGILSKIGVEAQDTNYDAAFTYECPNGQALYRLYSEHSDRYEDRRWTFGCRAIQVGVSSQNCTWTGWVNEFDGILNFQCAPDHVITGIKGYHCNMRQDRRFRFQCCRYSDFIMLSCSMTPYQNYWDGILDYTVPAGKVLYGAYSEHRNAYEDRRWRFKECDYFRN